VKHSVLFQDWNYWGGPIAVLYFCTSLQLVKLFFSAGFDSKRYQSWLEKSQTGACKVGMRWR